MTKAFRWRIDNVLFKAQTELSVKGNQEYHIVLNMTIQLLSQLLTIKPYLDISDFKNYMSHFVDWFLANGVSLGEDMIPVMEVIGWFYRNHNFRGESDEIRRRQLINLVLKTLELVWQLDERVGAWGLNLLTNIFFSFQKEDCDAFIGTEFAPLVSKCIEVLPRRLWKVLIELLQNVFSENSTLKIELLRDIRVQRLLFESILSPDLLTKSAAYDWMKALAQDEVSEDIHHYLCENMVILTTILKDIRLKANVGHLVVVCRIVGALLRIGNLAIERGWSTQNVFTEALLNDAEAMEALENLSQHGTKEIDTIFKTYVEKELPAELIENFRLV
jgi:hypothetical protein